MSQRGTQEENISKNVIAAIEAENPAKVKRIEELIPKRWQKLFSDFAGVVGSRFYNTLKNGTRVYYRFVLQKVSSIQKFSATNYKK